MRGEGRKRREGREGAKKDARAEGTNHPFSVIKINVPFTEWLKIFSSLALGEILLK